MFKVYKALKSVLLKQTRTGYGVVPNGRKGVERDTPTAYNGKDDAKHDSPAEYNGRDDAKCHSPAAYNKRGNPRRDSPAVFNMSYDGKRLSPIAHNTIDDVQRDLPIAHNKIDDVQRDPPVVLIRSDGAKLTNAQLGSWTVCQPSSREAPETIKQTRSDSDALGWATYQSTSQHAMLQLPTASNTFAPPRDADVVTDQIIEKANANVLTKSPPPRKPSLPIVPTEVKSDGGSDRATNVKSLITLFSAEHSYPQIYTSQHTAIYPNTSSAVHPNRFTTSYHGSHRTSRVLVPPSNVTSDPFKGVQSTIETLFKGIPTAQQQEEDNDNDERLRCWKGTYSRTDNSPSSRSLPTTHNRPGSNNSDYRRLQDDEDSHIRLQGDTKSKHHPRYDNDGHQLDACQSLQRHQRECIVEAIRILRRFQSTPTQSSMDTIDRANCLRPRDVVGLCLSSKTPSEARWTNSARNVSLNNAVVGSSGGHSGTVLANTEAPAPRPRGLSILFQKFHRRRSSQK